MKDKRSKFGMALLALAVVLAMVAPASAGGVQWFRWDACRTVFEWQADDVAVDGWTVELRANGGAVVWSSPFVPAGGSGFYSTPAPTAFEATGALLCEHVSAREVVCTLEATEVCLPAARGRR